MTFTSDITVKLINKIGGDDGVVLAARVSVEGGNIFEKEPGEHAGLINYLMKHRHGTPFEHGLLTFFVHAPIFVWREWHRHRVGFSYNEESARYKQLEPVFWLPKPERAMVPVEGFKSARPEFGPANPDMHRLFCEQLKLQYEMAYNMYNSLIQMNFAKEVARAVLPVGIYSSCWVTCNPRSLMHFLSLRTKSKNAAFKSYPQEEINDAATQCEGFFAEHWPITHDAWNKNGRVSP